MSNGELDMVAEHTGLTATVDLIAITVVQAQTENIGKPFHNQENE